ncbi:phage baseplate assembly protein V, partial [Dickeya undicola]
EITDKTSTLSHVRDIYDSHNHPGDSGGTTGAPNQSM